MSEPRRILVLALGNDLLGDDGVGLAAARKLKEHFGDSVDIVETSEAGLALMEWLSGYDRALLLDAVVTGQQPPGTIVEFFPDDFQRVIAPSPHYAGIPEVLAMAEQLRLPFPAELRILALEVENPFDFHEGFTPPVEAALDGYVEAARRILESWRSSVSCTNTP